MAFLLAILLAFGRLSGDSEITAMKASGVSSLWLASPGCVPGRCYLSGGCFYLSLCRPTRKYCFKSLLVEVVENRVSLGVKEKVFNADFPGIVIYADRYSERTQVMSGILIQDERDSLEPSTIIAEHGMAYADRDTKRSDCTWTMAVFIELWGKRVIAWYSSATTTCTLTSTRIIPVTNADEKEMSLAELRANWNSTISTKKEAGNASGVPSSFFCPFYLPHFCPGRHAPWHSESTFW